MKLRLFVLRLRIGIVKAVVWMLMPKAVWVGKGFGAYTCNWSVCLGKLDRRGVLQGVEVKSLLDIR